MAKSFDVGNLHVDVDQGGMREYFLTGCGQVLLEAAQPTLARCNAEAQAILHSPTREDAFDCDLRTLDNTQVAVIHPSHSAGAAANRAHGILHW